MSEQIGWRSVLNRIRTEAPVWGAILPTLPRAIDAFLRRDNGSLIVLELDRIRQQQRYQNAILRIMAIAFIALLALECARYFNFVL